MKIGVAQPSMNLTEKTILRVTNQQYVITIAITTPAHICSASLELLSPYKASSR